MTHSPMSQNRVRDALEETAAQYEALYGSVPEAARKFAADAWGETWSHAEMGSLLEFAALTAPPASDASGAEGLIARDVEALCNSVLGNCYLGKDPEEELAWKIRAALTAPTAPAQTPSRPVDAGGVEAERERCAHIAKMHRYHTDQPAELVASSIAYCIQDDSFVLRDIQTQVPLATQAPDKAGAREGLKLVDVRAEADAYEFRADEGDYTPTEHERAMLEDFGNGLIVRAEEALATQPTGTEASRPVGGEAPPCHWGGGNDSIWCSVCGEEYAYAKGEQRPPCPRTVISTPSAFSDSATSMAILPDREKLNRMARGGAASPMPPQADSTGQGDAISEIAAERRRQVEAEGWTPEHDDEHSRGEMATAAACYAFHAGAAQLDNPTLAGVSFGRVWPWDWTWWKPSNARRDLVKAGALIVAEIERLDRLATPSQADAQTQEGGR